MVSPHRDLLRKHKCPNKFQHEAAVACQGALIPGILLTRGVIKGGSALFQDPYLYLQMANSK